MSSHLQGNQTPVQTSAPHPVYLMFSSEPDDGIDLLELLAVLWRRKWIVVLVTVLGTAASVAYAMQATPLYRAEALLSPARSGDGRNLGGQLGGLANLAGLNVGSAAGGTHRALATLRSRAFIEEFILEENVLPLLYADRWDTARGDWAAEANSPDIRLAVTRFRNSVLSIQEDSGSGLVTLSVEWTDPDIAAQWAASLIARINERLRLRDLEESQRRLEYLNGQLESANLVELRQAISRLIEEQIQTVMLAEGETEYAFRVIDPPHVPHQRAWPSRSLMVIFGTLLGGMLGVLAALLYNAAFSRRATVSR